LLSKPNLEQAQGGSSRDRIGDGSVSHCRGTDLYPYCDEDSYGDEHFDAIEYPYDYKHADCDTTDTNLPVHAFTDSGPDGDGNIDSEFHADNDKHPSEHGNGYADMDSPSSSADVYGYQHSDCDQDGNRDSDAYQHVHSDENLHGSPGDWNGYPAFRSGDVYPDEYAPKHGYFDGNPDAHPDVHGFKHTDKDRDGYGSGYWYAYEHVHPDVYKHTHSDDYWNEIQYADRNKYTDEDGHKGSFDNPGSVKHPGNHAALYPDTGSVSPCQHYRYC